MYPGIFILSHSYQRNQFLTLWGHRFFSPLTKQLGFKLKISGLDDIRCLMLFYGELQTTEYLCKGYATSFKFIDADEMNLLPK